MDGAVEKDKGRSLPIFIIRGDDCFNSVES